MDVRMELMSGIEALKQISLTPNVLVIIMTAYSSVHSGAGIEFWAYDYLIKPLDLKS